MNIFLKQLLIIVCIILSVLGIYFGAYAPWRKSQAYINALKAASTGGVQSLGEYINNYDRAIQINSPIGNEEIAKFLSNDIMNIISKETQNEQVSRALVQFVEPFLFQNNLRHLLVGGQMHYVLWKRFQNDEDYKMAEKYYLAARAIGPKIPPVLYELIGLYRDKGDMEKMKEVGETILKYWPQDESIRSVIFKS
jgi:tetratricopeptide (TPR) repeat protein